MTHFPYILNNNSCFKSLWVIALWKMHILYSTFISVIFSQMTKLIAIIVANVLHIFHTQRVQKFNICTRICGDRKCELFLSESNVRKYLEDTITLPTGPIQNPSPVRYYSDWTFPNYYRKVTTIIRVFVIWFSEVSF